MNKGTFILVSVFLFILLFYMQGIEKQRDREHKIINCVSYLSKELDRNIIITHDKQDILRICTDRNPVR